ncbi:MAG: hypothetical protein KDH09_08145 [Chrysiogenetes bacterium]|nr:hypothetical protein [Chrysiogenetes bacterium]
MQRGLQILGGALALAFWCVNYYQLHAEPALFIVKSLVAALIVAAPAAAHSRVKHAPLAWWVSAASGAAVVVLGQWALYSFLPKLGTGEPIGALNGIREIFWDLSFRGTPGTLYGGMLLVGGVAAGLSWLIAPRSAGEGPDKS